MRIRKIGKNKIAWITGSLLGHVPIIIFVRLCYVAGSFDGALMMLLLGHGIALTCVGLVLLEIMDKSKRDHQALVRMLEYYVNDAGRGNVRCSNESGIDGSQFVLGELKGRPLKFRSDGVVEVQTMLGLRRFRNVSDAAGFIGNFE